MIGLALRLGWEAATQRPRLAAAIAISVLAAAIAAALWWSGYRAGGEKWVGKLKDDRIEILTNGKKIDDEVDGATDDALCRLLGGCELRP